MVVYADILIAVNFIVDYFLLAISARFLHIKPKLWRQLLSSLLGGAFSLYIFLPQSNFFVQSTLQILMCTALCFVAFGFGTLKSFCRSVVVLFAANFAYSGAMIALWLLFKPYGMVINNSVIYFNISPIFLILFSVLGYFIVLLLRRLLKKSFTQNTYCSVTLRCGNNSLTLTGFVDTGNTLTDAFGVSKIFITEMPVIDALMGTEKQNLARYRAIPCNTVTGQMLLNGYRIDAADIDFEKQMHHFKSPVLAVSQTPLDDCKIIVGAQDLN